MNLQQSLKYGRHAAWADLYFAHDLGTFDIFTQGALEHTFNVDVTLLDPDRWLFPQFCSLPLPCGFVASSAHGWPHGFYLQSITSGFAGYEAYGFARSKEGGGWNDRGLYPVGNSCSVVLDGPQSCFSDLALDVVAPVVDLITSPRLTSGSVLVGSSALTLTTTGPSTGAEISAQSGGTEAWISSGVTVTNPANAVLFDAQFIGTTPGEGLLSVYWETNEIGIVDERVAGCAAASHTLPLPFVEVGGAHLLGFRLDAYTATNSSLVITNVRTAWIAPPSPGLAMGVDTNTQLPELTISGFPGAAYLVESSTNLMDWATLGVFSSTNATMRYSDPLSVTNSQRFYRAGTW